MKHPKQDTTNLRSRLRPTLYPSYLE